MHVRKPFDDNKWFEATKFGEPIKLTEKVSIAAFKCPLHKKYDVWIKEDERMYCSSVLSHYKEKHGLELKTVLDLTNTDKYYDHIDWGTQCEVYKFKIRGKMVPEKYIVDQTNKLCKTVVQYASSENQLIGVHCTHGINRTGYIVCMFLK